MIDRENVIGNLEQNIRWIEEIECHHFPGWGNVTMAMRDAVELLKEQENQLTMKYEEGFHDGYRQAMSEAVPCYECQEFSCNDCKFKDNRTVKLNAIDRR